MVFSWQMAEELAAAHMRSLGFSDARRMPDGADGGIDVHASAAVAQVKYHSAPIGAPQIQQLRGAAHGIPFAVFYSSSGYTKAAIAAADATNVALFLFREDTSVSPLNHSAELLLAGTARSDAVQSLLVELARSRALVAGYMGVAVMTARIAAAAPKLSRTDRGRLKQLKALPDEQFMAGASNDLIGSAQRLYEKIDAGIAMIADGSAESEVELPKFVRAVSSAVAKLAATARNLFPGVDAEKWAVVTATTRLEDPTDPADRALRMAGFAPDVYIAKPPRALLAEVLELIDGRIHSANP